MSINPSNAVAGGVPRFPMIGDPPFSIEGKDQAVSQLRAAGFPRGCEKLSVWEVERYKPGSEAYNLARMGVYLPNEDKRVEKEWVFVYRVEAKLCGWEFRRAWYYWIARANYLKCALPQHVAEELNKEFYSEIRVEGFAGGQKVITSVESYHVDTPRGLCKLVEVLKDSYTTGWRAYTGDSPQNS